MQGLGVVVVLVALVPVVTAAVLGIGTVYLVCRWMRRR